MIGRIRRAGALALVNRVERYGNLQRFARCGPLAATRSATNGHIVISSNNYSRFAPLTLSNSDPPVRTDKPVMSCHNRGELLGRVGPAARTHLHGDWHVMWAWQHVCILSLRSVASASQAWAGRKWSRIRRA